MLDGPADGDSSTARQQSDAYADRSDPTGGESDGCGDRSPATGSDRGPHPTDPVSDGSGAADDATDGVAPPSADTTGAQSDDHTPTTTPTMTTNDAADDDSRTANDHTLDHGTDDLNDPVPVDMADGLFGDATPDATTADHSLDGTDDLNDPAPVDMAAAVPTDALDTDAQADETTDDGAHPMTTTTTTDDGSSTDTTTDGRLMTDGGQPTSDDGTPADEWTPTDAEPPTYGEVKDPEKTTWIDAVYAGFTTQTDAGEAMGASRPTAGRRLNALADRDDAPVVKFDNGNVTYAYDAGKVGGGGSTSGSSTGSGGSGGNGAPDDDPAIAAGFPKPLTDYPASMPDYRHTLDFSDKVPRGVPEYHPSGDEMDTLNDYANVLEQVDDPDAIGNPLTAQLVGPTGSGKTHAPEKVAETRGWAYYEITLKDSMDPSDLEGWPNVMDAFTAWTDGSLVEALLCTHEMPTILVLDEVNRAPPAVRSVFMSVLDSRAAVTLESRGGEVVSADKSNLLVVSTRNPGDDPDYETYDLDRAQESRLGRRCTVDFLGMDRPDKEADLLMDRQGVSEEWAEGAVAAANEVREAAAKQANTGGMGMAGGGGGGGNVSDAAQQISRGVPTRNLLMMARDAYLKGQAGRPDASMVAIRGHLENDYDGEALDIVEQKFSDKVAGVDPVGDNGNGLLDGNGGGA